MKIILRIKIFTIKINYKKLIKNFRVGLTAEKEYALVGGIGLARARAWLARFRDLIEKAIIGFFKAI
nr:MAG TPA: hypothetical protein [Caudoviricetes sp.]